MASGAVSSRGLKVTFLESFALMALQASLHINLQTSTHTLIASVAVGAGHPSRSVNPMMEHHMVRQLGYCLPGMFRSIGQG